MFGCISGTPYTVHYGACGCAPLPGRRGLLAELGALVALPRGARTASGHYGAMLVTCIDPRFTSGSFSYMGQQKMRDRYSQFVIAGGPIGTVHPRFAARHQAFWDNLAITVALHNMQAVVALSHRDCGAAKLAPGEAAMATAASETASHAEGLRVITGIMALEGLVETVP